MTSADEAAVPISSQRWCLLHLGPGFGFGFGLGLGPVPGLVSVWRG